MKTVFETKSYPGKNPRPRVEAQIFENEKILTVCTPWGNTQAQEKLLELVSQTFLNLRDDDLTITGHSSNKVLDRRSYYLKTLIEKANAEIQTLFNKDFYNSACEAFVMLMGEYHVSWAQVGQPAVLVLRNKQIQVLQSARDLSSDYSMAAPLPAQLLGVGAEVNSHYQNFLTQPGDVLIFFTGHHEASVITALKKYKEGNLTTQLFNAVAKENPDASFWLGCLFID